MNKTPAEWADVKAEAVVAGSTAQATNVLQMALDDIATMGAALKPFANCEPLGYETRFDQPHVRHGVITTGELRPKHFSAARSCLAKARAEGDPA